jgi:hypothetical protein
MMLLGQTDAADALRAVERTSGDDLTHEPGTAGDDPASRLVALIDSVATETDDGIDLFVGFEEGDTGRPLEAFELPTRWGLLSVALRWHGQRPAILWEIDAWDDQRPFGLPVFRAPRLDGEWTGSEQRGDALLRV